MHHLERISLKAMMSHLMKLFQNEIEMAWRRIPNPFCASSIKNRSIGRADSESIFWCWLEWNNIVVVSTKRGLIQFMGCIFCGDIISWLEIFGEVWEYSSFRPIRCQNLFAKIWVIFWLNFGHNQHLPMKFRFRLIYNLKISFFTSLVVTTPDLGGPRWTSANFIVVIPS